MNNEQNHIDQIVFDALANTSADAPGIGWNDFKQKKKKRIAALWLKFLGISIGVGVLLFFLLPDLNADKITTTRADKPNAANVHELEHKDSRKTSPTLSMVTESKNDTTMETGDVISKRFAPLYPKQPKQIAPLVPTGKQSELKSFKHFRIPPRNLESLKSDYKIPESLNLYSEQFPIIIDTTSIKETGRKAFVKIGLSGSYSNPSFAINSKGEKLVHKDYSSIRNASESGGFGYQLNVVGGITRNRFSPFLGLGLVQHVSTANYNFSYSEKPILDLDGTILGYQSETPTQINFKSQHKYIMINVPVGVEYNLLKKSSFDVNLVATMNMQMIADTDGELPGPVFLSELHSLSMSQFKLNSNNYSFGFNYTRHAGKYSWYIEPTYNFGSGIDHVKDLYSTNLNTLVITFGLRK